MANICTETIHFLSVFFSFLIETVLEISYGPLLTEEENYRQTIATCTFAAGAVSFPFARNTARNIRQWWPTKANESEK